MPVILYQVWAFVAPGLTPAERKTVRPWIPLALVFFALGVGIAYLVLPYALSFLFSFNDDRLVENVAAGPYFDFVTTMFLAFGLVMEFPILLVGLSRVASSPPTASAGPTLRDPRRSPSSRPSPRPVATSSARSCSAGRCTCCTRLTVLFIKRTGR